jgi:hypothetical protein
MTSREQLLARVRTEIEEGREISDIAGSLGMDPEDVNGAVREIFQSIAERLQGTPREHMFAEFLLVATGHMRTLHEIATKKGTAPRDAVAAIKTSWGIRTAVMSEARRFGVVSDRAGQIAGLDISFIENMSNEEIRHALMTLPEKVRRLERDYKNLNIMDVDAGPMFGVSTANLQN